MLGVSGHPWWWGGALGCLCLLSGEEVRTGWAGWLSHQGSAGRTASHIFSQYFWGAELNDCVQS